MPTLYERLEKDVRFKEGMKACMNCGVCTAICPAAEVSDYDPRMVVNIVQERDEAELEKLLKSDTIWRCGECLSCKTRCPRGNVPAGGNIEYAPEEMNKNGVTHIHFATGFLVGYPPCPYMEYFKNFIEEKYGMKVIYGTHPVPQKYYLTHKNMDTWNSEFLSESIKPTLTDELTRLSYD